MQRQDEPPPSPRPAHRDAGERRARLAAALRDNLAKRKAQTRARGAPVPTDDPPPPDGPARRS